MRRLNPTGSFRPADFQNTLNFIARTQEADGGIPWFAGGLLDPWDHVEAAMGLAAGGRWKEARAAFDWLQHKQHKDGSWFAGYQQGRVTAPRVESHFVAYVATGIWHYYLVTGDRKFAQSHWLMVQRAIDMVLKMQAPGGEIYWALDEQSNLCRDALLTGCSSIYKSLECAINLADLLGAAVPEWVLARRRLGEALLNHPESFDRTWESKARYAMDWYYPVICGLLPPPLAAERLQEHWQKFVVPDLGCRCVNDDPWVTIAESSELTLALLAAGDRERAARLFSWLQAFQDQDGGYWTGYVFRDQAIWPEEKTTWTAGAVLLAADALSETTGAAGLFTRVRLPEQNQATGRGFSGSRGDF